MRPQPLQHHGGAARPAGCQVPEQPVPVAVTTRLWLLRQGVGESPSPVMQNAALRACGLDWSYSVRNVGPDELGGAMADLWAGVAEGANVTIPHKRAAAALCDRVRGDAALTGAGNHGAGG